MKKIRVIIKLITHDLENQKSVYFVIHALFSQFQNRIFIEMLFGAFYSTRVGLAPSEISKLTRYSEIPLTV